jgi:LPS O-antigen subunit length determinant protein (WzzB/FepE family)
MKKTIVTLFVLFSITTLNAQKYFTKNATVTFLSKAPMETIEGTNKTTTAVIDAKTGAIAFSVLVKGFVFEKQLMQQHFNENYMESDKFPKAEFKGTITNNATVKYAADGAYNVTVSGKLTIHGVTKDATAAGKVSVADGKVSASSDFSVMLADYNINIPSVVKDKIGKTVKISINTGNMDKLK